jgi:hypothetical protein
MNNSELPISKVRGFAEIAEQRGCYSDVQRGNLDTAWSIFLKNFSESGGEPEKISVAVIRPSVEAVFRKYGSENRVSPVTVKTYQTRVNRLLDDFVNHLGGDFMAWKESLNRSHPVRQRRKVSLVKVADSTLPPEPASPSAVTHRIVLSRGREGALVLPFDLTSADVEPIWQQLDALKVLTQAQIAAKQGEGQN